MIQKKKAQAAYNESITIVCLLRANAGLLCIFVNNPADRMAAVHAQWQAEKAVKHA
jgi:hypothetical protein